MIIAFDTKWVTEKGLNVTEAIVFTNLYQRSKSLMETGAIEKKGFYRSNRDIAKSIDRIVAQDTVRKALVKLEEKGFIEVTKEGEKKFYKIAKV